MQVALCDSPEPSASPSPAGLRVQGRVVTEAGAPVSGARVSVESITGQRLAVVLTDTAGRFALEVPPGVRVRVLVEAAGLHPERQEWDPDRPSGTILVTLEPLLREQVVTTARRVPEPLAGTAASVAVVSREDLSTTAAARLDDVLRQVPGFSLFRRIGSRTANPTAQGVSLRGVGASGASRALVLDEGVPLNDPFGGWVYWGRVPRAALERIEVLQGGASDLYGSAALTGAVAFRRREVTAPFFAGEASAGSDSTSEASFAAGGRRGGWSGIAAGEFFQTDGSIPVAPEERGPVDQPAGSRDAVVDVAGARDMGPAGRLRASASWFDESRDNGTRLQHNDTTIRQGILGWDRETPGGSWSAQLYASSQDYEQTFSAIAEDRDTETLTRRQEVPSDALGAGFQWSGPAGPHRLVAGADFRAVDGESAERIFTASGESRGRAGGQQRTAGAFFEDSVAMGIVTLTGGVRADHWRESEGRSVTGGETTRFPSRGDDEISPRGSLLIRPGGPVSFLAAAYRSFRAPTLNELYRAFRVGNVFTEANPSLRAERLTGVEAGVRIAPDSARLRTAGATLFQAQVEDPVANVTQSVTPALITRQRMNMGRLRSRGVQLDLEVRPARAWSVAAGYLFVDSTVRDFPSDRSLEGRRVPQVPRHEVTARAAYRSNRLGTLSTQVRWTSEQFEDDANELALDSGLLVDAFYARPVSRSRWEAFLAVENLLDARVETGRTPATTLLPGITARAGLRVGFGD